VYIPLALDVAVNWPAEEIAALPFIGDTFHEYGGMPPPNMKLYAPPASILAVEGDRERGPLTVTLEVALSFTESVRVTTSCVSGVVPVVRTQLELQLVAREPPEPEVTLQ
jgi:hypothetical protein